nr:hypothetical protein [Tanacetum cinerariifolium]
TTLKIRTANDDVRLQALIDGKKVVITEASIRHDLKLNNTEGTSCLPNAMNFEKLARMGAKTTSWNEFSSTMASAIICLTNNQKLNFSKYILNNLKKNLEASVPFYMFHRRKEKNERKETKVSHIELPTEDPVPTPSSDPLPSELESRVEKLEEEENRSLTKELKSFNSKVDTPAYKETIKDKEKSSKQRRKIVDIDADAEVNLQNMYNLDLAHEETVLSMHDATDADVSTAGGELNAADKEPVSAAPTNITIAQPSEATKITVDISNAYNAKGIVFHDVEKSTTRTASLKAHVKDKGKAKLVEEPKVLKLRKAQITIDEEVARRIEVEWNADMQDNIDWNKVVKQVQSKQSDVEGLEIDAEKIKAPRKRTRKEKVEKDQTAKKQKGDKLEKENAKKQKLEEKQKAKELKRNLEIVPDDEDDVFVNVAPLSSKPPKIVDYKIYKEGKKEHIQIIRANRNHQLHLSFSKMLKNFDREDLEVLWKIVKDRFKESQPKEVLDVFLWQTLKVMFEHSVEDSVTPKKTKRINKEPVSAAPTNITIAQPSEATKITVDISNAYNAKGIVFHDVEKSTTRTASLKAHVKDKGKAKLVEEPKVLKLRKAQITIDEEVARRIEVEWNADMQDNIDWNKVVKQVQSKQSDVVRKYQALKRKPVSLVQARKNMIIYLKNMAGFKM